MGKCRMEKTGPTPPHTPPPCIAMLAMVDASLPTLQERQQKLERRLTMQRNLLAATEQELRELAVLIAKRTKQQDEALRRLHANDDMEKTKKLAAEHNQDQPRPSKSRCLG